MKKWNIRWVVMAALLAALPQWGNALVSRPEKGATFYKCFVGKGTLRMEVQ